MKKIARDQKPTEVVKATIVEAPKPSGANIGGSVKSVGFEIKIFNADGTEKSTHTGTTIQRR